MGLALAFAAFEAAAGLAGWGFFEGAAVVEDAFAFTGAAPFDADAFAAAAFDSVGLPALTAAGLALAVGSGAGFTALDFDAAAFGSAVGSAGEAAGFAAGFLLLVSFFAAFVFTGFAAGTLVAFATDSSSLP
jgi:hypothetical protein